MLDLLTSKQSVRTPNVLLNPSVKSFSWILLLTIANYLEKRNFCIVLQSLFNKVRLFTYKNTVRKTLIKNRICVGVQMKTKQAFYFQLDVMVSWCLLCENVVFKSMLCFPQF